MKVLGDPFDSMSSRPMSNRLPSRSLIGFVRKDTVPSPTETLRWTLCVYRLWRPRTSKREGKGGGGRERDRKVGLVLRVVGRGNRRENR